MAGFGANVVGLDGAIAQLNQAKKNYKGHNFLQGDLLFPLPFADGSFDAIVSSFTLMFVADLESQAREASRVIKPSGKLVLTVTHPFYPYLQERLGDKHRYSGCQVPNFLDTDSSNFLLY